MYSEALRIMDQNTIKYMIDELKAALSQKDSELSQRNSELLLKDSEIERLRTQLAMYEQQQHK